MNAGFYRGIGIMSGTSLDGLDLAYGEFEDRGASGMGYKLLKAHTVSYNAALKKALHDAYSASAESYFALHASYGSFIAQEVNAFIQTQGLTVDFIASHGHTIFHRPTQGFSTQIGCGATIAAQTGLTTVCDFRSLDVALNGQGAPLVPIGDELLFGEYDSCLNIGGIANISFRQQDQRRAFDICIANMALNHFSELLGKPYDEGGELARSGAVHEGLLAILHTIFKNQAQQSLGRELFETQVLPAIQALAISPQDVLATCTEHAARCVAAVLTEHHLKNVLITGGGAYNTYLLERLKSVYPGQVVIPDDLTIQFKEALIFAFLGYLRLHEKTNTLQSVTKARKDSIGGAVYKSSTP